jgi:hypothetical protein
VFSLTPPIDLPKPIAICDPEEGGMIAKVHESRAPANRDPFEEQPQAESFPRAKPL